MLQSTLFTKTRKEAPKDETSKNAILLIRGGFINKEIAGVYDYLPLGLRVLKNIENIIREEMNAIGGQEIFMSTLQDPEIWKKTDRWDDTKVDNWFKSNLVAGGEVGIASTHEEPITKMLTHFISSYKDLPLYVYQFQTKFRNELRAKSGLMRGKEFLMKDLYSFHLSEENFKNFYEKCAEAYLNIFERVGLGDITFRTIASGGIFTEDVTHEFQTISETGEDSIYVDRDKKIAINKEIYNDENLAKFKIDKKKLEEEKSTEVGNIFPLGTKYSEAMNLKIKGEDGKEVKIIMGSYGIGLGRLMGVVVETLSDNKGIVWPESIAPFKIHLIEIGDSEKVKKEAELIYKKLLDNKIEVLYDDRKNVRAGEKFADSDLLGISTRAILSEENLSKNRIEVVERKSGKVHYLSTEDFVNSVR